LQKVFDDEFSALFLEEINLIIDFLAQNIMGLEHCILHLWRCDICTNADIL